MCCEQQEDAEGNCPEGAQGSDCFTHHPNTGIFTCGDHQTAVRGEGNFLSYSLCCQQTVIL